MDRLRHLIMQVFAEACRDGCNVAVATAVAVQAVLDHRPGLSIPEAYQLVTEVLGIPENR